MTYSRVKPYLILSENSDYSQPHDLSRYMRSRDIDSVTFVEQKVSVPTSGLTIDLGAFTTVSDLIVQNLDSTNYVTLAATNASASAAVAQRLAAGTFTMLPDVKVSSDFTLTANSSACVCSIVIIGQ